MPRKTKISFKYLISLKHFDLIGGKIKNLNKN